MSADNWSVCPRCTDRALQKVVDAREALMKDYGVVPVEEFERRNAELLEAELDLNESEGLTFREDYEWYGADEGTIHGSYRGACSVCGLKVKVAVDHPFYPEAET